MAAMLVNLIGYLLLGGMAYFAYKDNFLFVSQLLSRKESYGIPLVAHGGYVGDVLYLTPVLSYVIQMYGCQWRMVSVLKMASISIVLTVGLVVLWVNCAKKMPEALSHDGKLTLAGFLHAIYFAGAATIFLLFFFYTQVAFAPLVTVSLILWLHLFAGNHIPLSLMRFEWYNGKNYKDVTAWSFLSIIGAVMIWRCNRH